MDGVPTGPASRRRGHSPVGAADMGDRPAEVGSGCAGRSPVRRMRLGEVLFGPADWPVGVGVWTHPRLTSWRGVGPPIFGRT